MTWQRIIHIWKNIFLITKLYATLWNIIQIKQKFHIYANRIRKDSSYSYNIISFYYIGSDLLRINTRSCIQRPNNCTWERAYCEWYNGKRFEKYTSGESRSPETLVARRLFLNKRWSTLIPSHLLALALTFSNFVLYMYDRAKMALQFIGKIMQKLIIIQE